MFYIYLKALQYDNILFSFTLFPCLKNALFCYIVLQYYRIIDVVLALLFEQYLDYWIIHS